MEPTIERLARQPDVVDDVMVGLSRQKTAAELTGMASRMFAASRDRLAAYLRQTHPNWTQERLRAEMLGRIHGTK